MMKIFTLIAVLISLIGVHGCAPGPRELKGGMKSKNYESDFQKGETTKEPVNQSSGSTTPSTDGESDSNPNEKLPSLPDRKVATPMPPRSDPSEAVIPPVLVTGAYLTCAVSSMDKSKSEVVSVCQLRDTKTNKVVDPSLAYEDLVWSAVVPSSIQILEIRNLLPRKNFWHASFHFKTNIDNFKSVSREIDYKMAAVRSSDKALLRLEQKTNNTDRPNFYLQNQFLHGSEAARCLDFSFDRTADHKGTTGGCRNSLGQRMNFNADGSIGLNFPDASQCMTYDPGTVNNYVEPRGCFEASLPRPIIQWEITGQELRWRGSSLCLSRAGPQTDPSNDYIGMQKCNGAADQRWEIIPF